MSLAMSGISLQRERSIMFVYPSVSATGLGLLLGRFDSALMRLANSLPRTIYQALRPDDMERRRSAGLQLAVARTAVILAGAAWYALMLPVFGLVIATGALAALVYLVQKSFGHRYEVSNRHLAVWKMFLGVQAMPMKQIPLGQIADIRIEQQDGQAFYKSADLVAVDAGGSTLARLKAVPRADVFRQIILEARDAHTLVEQSLATIQARQPA